MGRLVSKTGDLLIGSDAVASRLQISDLYKSDLQVSSRFANWNKGEFEQVY